MKNKILNNIILLYIVFTLTCVDIGYFLYKNEFQSILIFSISCLIIYLMNKNMIVVLGISILFVNLNRFLQKKEGFKEGNKKKKKNNSSAPDESEQPDGQSYFQSPPNNSFKTPNSLDESPDESPDEQNNSDEPAFSPLSPKSEEPSESSSDGCKNPPCNSTEIIETTDTTTSSAEPFVNYIYDTNVFNKIKKNIPNMFDTLQKDTIQNINSVHINEINSYINSMRNVIGH